MKSASDNQRSQHKPEHTPAYPNGEQFAPAVLCAKSNDAHQNPDNRYQERCEHEATVFGCLSIPRAVDLPRSRNRIERINLMPLIHCFDLGNVLAACIDKGRVVLAGVLIRAFDLKRSHGSLLGTLAGGFQ